MDKIRIARISISFYSKSDIELPPEVETRLEDLASDAEYDAIKITRDFPGLGLRVQVDEE